MMDDAYRERAAGRHAALLRRAAEGAADGLVTVDRPPPSPATAEERLALVTELSLRCWALSGQPMPSYTRATMPGRLIRG